MSLDFVALDVETANSSRGSICSFGLAEVVNGQVGRVENWLTQPPEQLSHFDGFNISLHGITPAMVANEPTFEERLQQVVDFIDGRIVVAHYAPFDTGAIRDGCDYDYIDWPTIDYTCTVVLSRRVVPLLSYKLPFVCDELGISLVDHHQAGADAAACAQIAVELARRQQVTSIEDLCDSVDVRLGRIDPDSWHGSVRVWKGGGNQYGPIPEANTDADPSHPFYGQTMVFTGALQMRREDAWAAVAALGATPENGVNKRTTMLVVGSGFTGASLEEFQTSKASKALVWQAKGHTIEVLGENDFMDMLADGLSGKRGSNRKRSDR